MINRLRTALMSSGLALMRICNVKEKPQNTRRNERNHVPLLMAKVGSLKCINLNAGEKVGTVAASILAA